MNLRNINWKNVLILILFLIIGFGIGMIVIFEIILKKLSGYNITI